MVYQFKKGSRIKVDPQVAGAMLEELETENNLTAKALVDVNRPEDAPLHDEFEWDDSVAAEAYRENQARHIINSLEVVIEEAPPVRAFFNIQRTTSEYQHITAILKTPDAREELFKQALSELLAFKRKYSELTDFSKVFDAIDEVEHAVKKVV